MDTEGRLTNVEAVADSNRKNVLALVGRTDGFAARLELVEKGAERRDREMLNLREQMNLLSQQVTDLQLALVKQRSYDGNND